MMHEKMRLIRIAVLVAVTLSMTACINVQCAAGQNISQNMDVDPLVGVVAVIIAGTLFLIVAISAGGGGNGRPM